MEKLKICVLAPDFRHSSGGIFVLHYLAKLLNDLGHEVTMTTCVQNQDWPSYAYADRMVVADIFVVPEIFMGDLHNVCRWVLNKPGVLAGPTTYADHERVWYFCDELKESAQAATNHPVRKLFLPSIDPEILPDEMVKDKKAFFVGKYKGIAHGHPSDAIPITPAFPASRKQTYELLAQCEEFWCYDSFSGIACEADHFGAKVFVWNGSEWQNYIPKWNFDDYVMLSRRDRETVAQFVSEAREIFNL